MNDKNEVRLQEEDIYIDKKLIQCFKSTTKVIQLDMKTAYRSLLIQYIQTKLAKTLPATTNTIYNIRKSIRIITPVYLQIPNRLSPINPINLLGAQRPHESQ